MAMGPCDGGWDMDLWGFRSNPIVNFLDSSLKRAKPSSWLEGD
jgi:hypothetical protein